MKGKIKNFIILFIILYLLTITVLQLLNNWFDGIFTIFGLLWFGSMYLLKTYTFKKYPKMYKNHSFFGFPFKEYSFNDAKTIWKEMFWSSVRNDKKYKVLLLAVRLSFLIIMIMIIYWTFFSW